MRLRGGLAYCESPQSYTATDACVYLDTGLLFKLFGIDSSDRADSYELFVKNVQKLGMHVKVYDHTVSEMIGSIVNSNRTCSLHWHKLF